MDWIVSIALFALAILSALLFGYFSFFGKTTPATLMALFSIVMFIFVRYPNIELIKIWGMETKIREQADRAEFALNDIRTLSIALSNQAYMFMAYVGRLATPTWDESLQLDKAISDALRSTKSDPEATRATQARFQEMLAVDCANTYITLRSDRLRKAGADIDKINSFSISGNLTVAGYVEQLKSDPILNALPQQDRDVLKNFAKDSGAAIKESLATHKLAPYLSQFLNADTEGFEKFYVSLFGEKPHQMIPR